MITETAALHGQSGGFYTERKSWVKVFEKNKKKVLTYSEKNGMMLSL